MVIFCFKWRLNGGRLNFKDIFFILVVLGSVILKICESALKYSYLRNRDVFHKLIIRTNNSKRRTLSAIVGTTIHMDHTNGSNRLENGYRTPTNDMPHWFCLPSRPLHQNWKLYNTIVLLIGNFILTTKTEVWSRYNLNLLSVFFFSYFHGRACVYIMYCSVSRS